MAFAIHCAFSAAVVISDPPLLPPPPPKSLVLASLFHHKFEKIHPFMDGNGRIGRMLLNLILLENNYPPLIVHKKFREEYLDSMKDADKENILSIDKKAYDNLIKFTSYELTNHYWDLFL